MVVVLFVSVDVLVICVMFDLILIGIVLSWNVLLLYLVVVIVLVIMVI